MNTLRKTAFFTAIALLPMNALAAEPASDTWLQTKIVTAYTLNRHLSPFTIDTDVANGNVTLRGKVESDVERELAERIASSVDGVRSVKNNLTVADSTAKRPNKFYQSVEDATTAATIYSKLLSNRNVNSDKLKIISNDGLVTLQGSVRTDSEQELAEMIALDTSGVRDVKNELIVRNEAPSTVAKAEKAISDTWITTKVRSNLVFSSGTSGSDVNIDTNNGVVTLTGKARTNAQKELIERIAEDVTGVKDVKNSLQISRQS